MTAPDPGPPRVEIRSIRNIGDRRGGSFSIPPEWNRFLPSVVDMHITTLRPGHVRGNHYHRTRKEVIVVVHSDGWTLLWDNGETGGRHMHEFAGSGAVWLSVDPGAAHAILNSGTQDVFTVGLTDAPYDPADTVLKELARADRT